MHPSSFENMRRCLEWYRPRGAFRVADLGSAGVNGTYRDLFGDEASYLGLDLEPGPNVDIVQEDPYRLPLDDGSIELVISGQMLEHCAHFWRVFGEVARVLTADGLAFMIAPSAGPIHRYPVDCYRFYPDAWTAVAEWSGLRLVDWWLDERGPWRDLVGVFQKGGSAQRVTGPRVQAAAAAAAAPNADPAVEKVSGRRPYLDVLRTLHELLVPKLYCEIGVRKGASLALCKGRSVAVDPVPEVSGEMSNVALYRETSDDFFFFHAKEAFDAEIDFAFIDGMHHCEFAFRDFMNLERFMSPNGVIVIDDVLPNHPLQASRQRQSRAWTGDIWKFAQLLAEKRPDLELTLFDTSPSGLLLIRKLDPRNATLWDHYNPWVRALLNQADAPVPAAVLERQNAVDPTFDAIAAAIGRRNS